MQTSKQQKLDKYKTNIRMLKDSHIVTLNANYIKITIQRQENKARSNSMLFKQTLNKVPGKERKISTGNKMGQRKKFVFFYSKCWGPKLKNPYTYSEQLRF